MFSVQSWQKRVDRINKSLKDKQGQHEQVSEMQV